VNSKAPCQLVSQPGRVGELVSTIPVYALLPPRLLLLDVAGPLEVLRRANELQDAVRFDVHYIGCTPSLRSSIGLTVADIEPLPARLPERAWLVVNGEVDRIMCTRSAHTAQGCESEAWQEQRIVRWLEQLNGGDHRLICICSGALLAGRAGLLDGHACTTHYLCCEELARLAPRARVLANRLYVEDGACCTSAGITTGIDLMLHLIARTIGHTYAVSIARYLVVYLRRSGSDPQLSPWLEGRNHTHPAVHRVQDAVAADPTAKWTVVRLARISGVSPRHLSRLFQEHAGMSLVDYCNRLRIALAHELLSHTRLGMDHIAERAGFNSSRQLRRVWRRHYKTVPRAARIGTALLHEPQPTPARGAN
jgi:transcriptional regulator GlxA family with amidase domain